MSATGQIFIEALDLYAYHGHFAEEGRLGQRFSMDLVLDCDLRASSVSDDLEDTVDYGAVVALVSKAFSARRFRLLEAAARALADAILEAYPKVTRVGVTLRKPAPPIPGRMESVGIRLDFTRER
jgi:dihydroneopterin aldolase